MAAQVNDAQHSPYSAYLRQLADLMHLRDWEIELLREWADEHTYAQALPFHQEKHLHVKIAEGFDGHPPHERREWLVHELAHAHLGQLDRAVDHLCEVIDDATMQYFKKQHCDESEVLVQTIARIIAPFMPLPPEVKT